MTSTSLEDVMTATGDDAELTEDAVRAMFANATGLDLDQWAGAWEIVDSAVIGAQADLTGLHMRPGGWVLNLRASAVRAVLAAALLGGVMWPAGFDQLPGDVLPKVLPLLIDVRRCRLTRSERRLLVDLRLSESASQMAYPWPAEALYGRLPEDVQSRVSPVDFVDFLDHLVQTGEADRSDHDEVSLRHPGHPAWIRITIE